jgi:methionyl-tRNA formyltransferase
MRIVFMGTPEFAVPALSSLINSEHEVVAVYSQPDEPAGRGRRLASTEVKTLALNHSLTVRQPASLKNPEDVQKLAELRPAGIVVAAYGQLLPQAVLKVPPLGCVNIHPSLLPRHRGPSPVSAAILAGDEVTGVSIILMDRGMDTGPVLAQREWNISPEDTTGGLTERLAEVGAQLLMETLPSWLGGMLTPRPQDDGKATYSKILAKEDGQIDWRCPAAELWRRVRAFQPWPGCYTTWQGKLLKILEAVYLPGEGEVGMVAETRGADSAPIGVQTGEGILGLVRVQLQGKRAMSADEFVRGQRTFVGSSLPG